MLVGAGGCVRPVGGRVGLPTGVVVGLVEPAGEDDQRHRTYERYSHRVDDQPSSGNSLDDQWEAARDPRRCTAVGAGRRCQLRTAHPGWPHVHSWTTEGGRGRRLVMHRWVWDDGQPGQDLPPSPLDSPPPWAT